jgi:hypothetical protein
MNFVFMTNVLLFKILLWFSVLSLGVWVGGTLFHMLVLQPMWSYDPPASVRFFFRETRFNKSVWNFYGPPFMAARLVPLILCVTLGWRCVPQQQGLLLVAGVTWIAITFFTLIYIYPINDVLFLQAGGSLSPEQVRAMVGKWLFADRLRFAVGTAGYLCLLKVFSLCG